jgi:hypothetical protein
MDRRLLERTIELAAQMRAFGSRQLRAALDSSPLWGTSRVEDTYNLLGHALRKALGVIARKPGRELATIAVEAEAGIVGGTSLKAALDLDWDDPSARGQALVLVLGALEAVERWLESNPVGGEESGVRESLAVAHQVRRQDVELAADKPPTLRRKVAKDRRIAIEDHEMRHGRKSKHQRIDGYKRHVLRDLDSGLVRSVGVTSANVPDASVTEALMIDLAAQSVQLSELHIDRAYLSSLLVRERPPELMIRLPKPGPYAMQDGFQRPLLSWTGSASSCGALPTSRCPLSWVGLFTFPQRPVQPAQCGSAVPQAFVGEACRSILMSGCVFELRQRQLTPRGRAKLRERITVEHGLAHIGHWQGRRARYRGSRKNLFDLRRCAVVHNLHVIARFPMPVKAA